MSDPVVDVEMSYAYFLRRMNDCHEYFDGRLHQAVYDSEKLLPGRDVSTVAASLRTEFKKLRLHESSLLSPLERRKGIARRQQCDAIHRATEVQFCELLCERFELSAQVENRIWALSERRIQEACAFRRRVRMVFDTSQFMLDDIKARASRSNADELRAVCQELTSYLDTVFINELHVIHG